MNAELLARIGLASGERVIWQGQPGRGLRLGWMDLPITLFMLFWVSIPAQAIFAPRTESPFDYMLLLFLAVGGYMLAGRFVVDAYARSHTDYVLTNRRAIIARSGLVPQRRSILLANIPELTLHEGRSGRGSILFRVSGSSVWHRGGGMQPTGMPGSDPGFLMIHDVQRVYDLVVRAQNGAA